MVIIGSIKKSRTLKEIILQFLIKENFEFVEIDEDSDDFVSLTKKVCDIVKSDSNNLGIIIDEYGVSSFIVSCKIKGIIAANISDERSAYMTRSHNNSNVMTLGSGIVGEKLALNIVKEFLYGKYDGGRHQIRVDMLNKMC